MSLDFLHTFQPKQYIASYWMQKWGNLMSSFRAGLKEICRNIKHLEFCFVLFENIVYLKTTLFVLTLFSKGNNKYLLFPSLMLNLRAFHNEVLYANPHILKLNLLR